MNPEAKAYLDNILTKQVAALQEHEREFLCARQSYLTDEQRETFAEVLHLKKTKKHEDKADDQSEESFADLKERAKELGIKVKFGISRQELEQLIEEAQRQTQE